MTTNMERMTTTRESTEGIMGATTVKKEMSNLMLLSTVDMDIREYHVFEPHSSEQQEQRIGSES